jgi:hypothetical protein
MACSKRLVDRLQDQHSTLYCVFKYENEAGDPIDMTGAVATLTIKSEASDTDIEALAQTTYNGDAGGVFTLSTALASIPVGTYRYDIIVVDSGGTREVLENLSIVIQETVAD